LHYPNILPKNSTNEINSSKFAKSKNLWNVLKNRSNEIRNNEIHTNEILANEIRTNGIRITQEPPLIQSSQIFSNLSWLLQS
jgi:hypothetical protein